MAQTNPLLTLAWVGARLIRNAASQTEYPIKVRAESLTVTRSDGTVETDKRTQALRAEQYATLTAAIAARVKDAIAAEPKGKATPERTSQIIAEVTSAFMAEGQVEFVVRPRADRATLVDPSADIAAMLAEQAES